MADRVIKVGSYYRGLDSSRPGTIYKIVAATQHDWAFDCVDLEPGEVCASGVYQIVADKLGEEMTLDELQKFKDETFEERVECLRRQITEIEEKILEHKKRVDSF